MSGPKISPRQDSMKEVGWLALAPSGRPVIRILHLLDLLSRSSTLSCSCSFSFLNFRTADSSVVILPSKSFIEVSMAWIVWSCLAMAAWLIVI